MSQGPPETPLGSAPAAPGAGTPEPGGAVEPGAVGPVPTGPGYPEPYPSGASAPPARGRFGIRQDPPGPPHRWGIGAFVLAEAVFLGVSVLVGRLLPLRESGVGGVLLALVVPTVGAAAVALLVTRLRGNGPRIDLGLRWSWDDVGAGVVIGIAGLFLTVPAALVYAWVVGPEGMGTAVGDVFGGLRADWPMALLVMAAVVIVAPICEEILYRGLLWGAVAKHVRRGWIVYLVTTLLFALAHFELTRTPLLFVVALPLGLARLLTGRLTASILAHQINNFLPGLALALMLVGVIPV